MKRTIAIAVLLGILAGLAPGTAQAHGAASAALALGSFAVFNQILFGIGIFGFPWAYPAPAYYPPYYPAPVYAPPVHASPAPTYNAVAARPAYTPPLKTEVVYPHGRYVLRGDGVSVAYRWVWIPNPPPPPPADYK